MFILFVLVGYTSGQCLGIDTVNGPGASGLQTLLTHIAVSDHVVATNWVGGGVGEKPFSISLSEELMKKITNALSTARNVGGQKHPAFEWGWQLQFYRETQLAEAICFNGASFLAEGVWQDDTGVLEQVYSDCRRKEYLNRVYKDEEKEFAAEAKVEARQWLRSSLHFPYAESKAKVLKYVNAFYDAGAAKVFMAKLRKKAVGKTEPLQEARLMIVVLPETSERRQKVFDVVWKAPREWMNDPDPDVGQKYLWYGFDWYEAE
jgi:hypothetical protein